MKNDNTMIGFEDLMTLVKKNTPINEYEFFKRAFFNAVRQSKKLQVTIGGKEYTAHGMNKIGLNAKIELTKYQNHTQLNVTYQEQVKHLALLHQICYECIKGDELTTDTMITRIENGHQIETINKTTHTGDESFIELSQIASDATGVQITLTKSSIIASGAEMTDYVVDTVDTISEDPELGNKIEQMLSNQQQSTVLELTKSISHEPKAHKKKRHRQR